MENTTVNNKRIAKNAIYLYIRTFIIMLVTLYTSRVILQILGETDYGVYNVVGGITIMFTFVINALTSATQRFLNYELGKGNKQAVKDVFCMSMNIYLIVVCIVIFLGETIGLWFLNTQLNIPVDRIDAAKWVYQFSIIASCLAILRIPYNACIVAHEKMSFYAYISIAEATLKLGTVFLLMAEIVDNLIFYSILLGVVALLILIAYYVYCIKSFDTCNYKVYWSKETAKQLLGFSGWSIFGSIAVLCANQGVSFIMNIFCGVIVNAALGIASQVSVAINSFVTGFQTAFNPQLVKSYANNEKEAFFSLLYRSSRISYLLMLIPAVAMYFWCGKILHIWLCEVPEFAIEFTQMIILYALIDSLSNPLWISVQATGKVKNYQCWVSLISLMNLPIAYFLLKAGLSPITVMVIKVLINAIIHIGRMIHLKFLVKLSFRKYNMNVMSRVLLVTLFSLPYPICFYKSDNVLLHIVVTLMISTAIAFLIGLNASERQFFFYKIHLNKK